MGMAVKLSVDNQIVRLFSSDVDKVLSCPIWRENISFHFTHPTFLEYLELGDILAKVTPFDETGALFQATITALCEVDNPEDLFYIYDSLFAEMLNRIKALEQIEPNFLMKRIREKKESLSFWSMEKILSLAMAEKEKEFKENTYHVMHDLTLYLAWDRMCIAMSRLFDYQSQNPIFLNNLRKLKWCLMESYQHIRAQGKTRPSFYRMMEALIYYQMREEHLELHKEGDWELLSQSFTLLKHPNEWADCFYSDCVLVADLEEVSFCHLTTESSEMVERRLALTHYMIDHLKDEAPKWKWTLPSHDIRYLL